MRLDDNESVIPLMLLLNYNRADVILPANWGMPFWVAFIYAGARSGEVLATVILLNI